MQKGVFVLFGIFSLAWGQAQNVATDSISDSNLKSVDLKYREDQFYAGVTHSILQTKPRGFSPRTLSLGLQAGFLRDFPINKKRTWAIAPGFGFSYFNLHNNLAAIENVGYMALGDYKKNTQSRYFFDLPIELRWRTSTPETHKFWRIYLGFKASYLLSNRNRTSHEVFGSSTSKSKAGLNEWTYSTYLSAGFNTWNIHLSYGLNTIYKEQLFEGDPNRLRYFNAGLMFYIL